MKERRPGSSWVGGIAGVLLMLYGASTALGFDALQHVSPSAEIGMAGVVFGILMILWAFKLMGADTVTMIVGVIAALIVVSTFVRDGKALTPTPIATKAMAVLKR